MALRDCGGLAGFHWPGSIHGTVVAGPLRMLAAARFHARVRGPAFPLGHPVRDQRLVGAGQAA
jgi:hypothetical protein